MAYKKKEDTIAYNNEYNKKAYDRINFLVPKGQKQLIQAIAARNNQSVNAFIWGLIKGELEREGITISGDSNGISVSDSE